MSTQQILVVLALVCFLLGAINWPTVRVNLVSLGLALLVLAYMIH